MIGGCAPINLHDYYYLTSPVIDLSTVTGSVYLKYWRWLNSDYTPFMHNVVQVYDGAAWVTVWQTGSSASHFWEAQWTAQSFDVSAYKNASFQIRIGYNITSGGVWTVSSWNLDDVSLSPTP